nr:6936_t:CDS:2 [Entrophospora candida]
MTMNMNGRRNNNYSDEQHYRRNSYNVSNVHHNATIPDLKDFFSGYGTVDKINIVTREIGGIERSTGTVYVTFKPPPENFWRQTVRFHGRMGIFLDKDTFVSEWKSTERVKFIVDYKRLDIKIIFGFGNYTFRLEVQFKDIDVNICAELDDSDNESRAILTVPSKYPAKFWMLDEFSKPKNKFKWNINENWFRKTEIRTEPRSPHEKSLPLQLHVGNDQLGRWTVYRVSFDLTTVEGGFKRFRGMIRKAVEFRLTNGQFNRLLRVVKSNQLNKCLDYSILKFDVLYMLQSAISHNYLNEYTINYEFINLLAAQKTDNAVYILESMSSRKRPIYDPLTFLKNEIIKQKNIERRPKVVPEYCVLMRKAVVTPTTVYFLLPTMETSNRIIRHYSKVKDSFLRVQFIDEAGGKVSSSLGTNNDALYNRIFYTLVHGIKIGDRHYEFLAFSSSQLREHSCWFFAPTDNLTAHDIREWMGDFKDIKVVAKYAARMGQCFSSTRAIAHLPVNDIKEIPDIIRNRYNFSDGVGKISPALSKKIAETLELKTIPSAFQFRLGGFKGVLCQSRYLMGSQIHVRPSQNKFESVHKVLEVIRGSCFIAAYLNRQAITLLSTLGVPDQVFISMKDDMVHDLDKMLNLDHNAMKVLLANTDEFGITRMMADMVKAGFLLRKEPFLVNLISLFRTTMLHDLKKKAKIRVENGAFLLGVLDETETLRENEVYCCISDPQNPSARKVVTGTCIVFRNPCFHPGDVRVVTAVNVKKLDYLVDVLVFPAKGYRDIPSQCSGGDLDGDDFTIIWDKRLIPETKNWEPMNYEAPKPVTVDDEVEMHQIKKFFVNYILSDQLGQIANTHLAKADHLDGGAFHGQCIRLAQLHSEAVDFPKTGIPAEFPSDLRTTEYPDFMEKPDKPSYISNKVLGNLYRSIELPEFNPCTSFGFDERLCVPGYEYYLEEARMTKRRYDTDIRGLMNQFGIRLECEVVSGFIVNSTVKIEKKKPRDVKKSVMDAIMAIQKQYRKILEEEFYAEGTNTPSPDASNKMEAKAFSWYYVTYHPAEIGADPEENMISFPWIAYEVLCSIASRNSRKARKIDDIFNQNDDYDQMEVISKNKPVINLQNETNYNQIEVISKSKLIMNNQSEANYIQTEGQINFDAHNNTRKIPQKGTHSELHAQKY